MSAVLSRIKKVSDSLKSNPSEIDVNEIIDVLSCAYLAAADGIQRSGAAMLLPDALKELDSLKGSNLALRSEFSEIKSSLERASADLSKFDSLFSSMKASLKGKISLLSSYSDDFKQTMYRTLAGADVSAFLDLQLRFEEEFRESFFKQPGAKIDTGSRSTEIINPKFYQSGG